MRLASHSTHTHAHARTRTSGPPPTLASHARTRARTTRPPRLAPWQNQSAHDNLNENLPIFAAAVIACMTMGVPVATVSAHATLWLVLRTAYYVAYVTPINALTQGNPNP